jgi:TPP-dependent pyruvate/acetoin dehydrogenase alpha subunit
MATYLVESGIASEAWITEAGETAEAIVAEAIEFAKAAPEPEPETLYTDMYSPEFMKAQGIEL